jgi:hypothetical protein
VVTQPGAEGEVRHFGTIGGDVGSVERMVKQLQQSGRRLHFVYEAGRAGFTSTVVCERKGRTAPSCRRR